MNAAHLQQVVEEFRTKQVLVVGDVMLDEYVWGAARRISPEAPVPIVQITGRTFSLGGAANVAANVVGLGGRAILAGIVGEDEEAERLIEVLRPTGINIQGVIRDARRPTTHKSRIMANGRQIARVDRETTQPLDKVLEDRFLAWIDENIAIIDVCVLSDYAKGVVTQRVAQELIRMVRSRHKPIIVDPKGSNYGKYRGATVIKPNTLDLEQVLGCDIDSAENWRSAGGQLASMLPETTLLISRGSDGMMLFQPGHPSRHIPSSARDVFDVTGAGDTVVAALALTLSAQVSPEVGAYLASRAAEIAVCKLGTAAVTAQELLDRLRQWSEVAAN